jgi:hypothetical protein
MSYIGNPINSVAFLTDQFSGNGSTTAFTMSVAPATTGSVLVAVSGVLQDPSTYSVVGTTLTFSAAPPSGTGNVSVRYLGIPASGVTTTAYRTVTEFTATAGQTTFSVPSYTVGYIDVYRNGVRQGAADFTATNGTTVVLASAAAAGDLITTESFYVSSVLNAIPAVAGAVNSTYITDAAVTPAKLSQPMTAGTAVASTSGTSIDFTGIPSWVKRVTVMYNGVSTNGSSNGLIQLGSGSVKTSGYLCSANNSAVGNASYTTGFGSNLANTAGAVIGGSVVFTLFSGNTWVASSGSLARTDGAATGVVAGYVTLSGALDRVRVTTETGTDTFDAGSVNILYEG